MAVCDLLNPKENFITIVYLKNGDGDSACLMKKGFHGSFSECTNSVKISKNYVFVMNGPQALTHGNTLGGTSYSPVPKTFIAHYFKIYKSFSNDNLLVCISLEALMASYRGLDQEEKNKFREKDNDDHFNQIHNELVFVTALKRGRLYYKESEEYKSVLDYSNIDVKRFRDHLVWNAAILDKYTILYLDCQQKENIILHQNLVAHVSNSTAQLYANIRFYWQTIMILIVFGFLALITLDFRSYIFSITRIKYPADGA